MPLQIFTSFVFYSFVCGITPGPANLASLATSLQFGKRAFLRQWVGLFCGFFTDAMVAAVILYAFGTALNKYVSYLAVFGAAYMCYLAWHIYKSEYDDSENEESAVDDEKEDDCKNAGHLRKREPSFWTGFFLQLTNVKVILTCITAISSYVLPVYQSLPLIIIWGVPVVLIGPVTNLVWGFTGLGLKKLFARYTKIVNSIMAVSLLLCAVSLITVMF